LLKATENTAPADTINEALIVEGSIQFGDFPAHEQRVLVVSKGALKADGVLGTTFLKKYRYAFDMQAKKLYLSALRKPDMAQSFP